MGEIEKTLFVRTTADDVKVTKALIVSLIENSTTKLATFVASINMPSDEVLDEMYTAQNMQLTEYTKILNDVEEANFILLMIILIKQFNYGKKSNVNESIISEVFNVFRFYYFLDCDMDDIVGEEGLYKVKIKEPKAKKAALPKGEAPKKRTIRSASSKVGDTTEDSKNEKEDVEVVSRPAESSTRNRRRVGNK